MGKDDNVEDAVYEYMKAQNRPYSAADVFSNLHKAHGKTAIIRAMEALAEKQKLLEKAYGKSKIYVINQNEFPDVSDAAIETLDKDVAACSEKCKTMQDELKKTKSQLKTFQSSLTTEEAKLRVEKLHEDVKNLKQRLIKAKETTPDMTEEERKEIFKDHKSFVCHWKKRKRMTTDLMNAILEGYPKSKKIFIEETGIETDEEFNVKIPVV